MRGSPDRNGPPGNMGSSRRDFLRTGAVGTLGLGLGDFLAHAAVARAEDRSDAPPARPNSKAKARAVIQLWMGGGPPQTDTFDPKPEAGEDYSGPFKKPLTTRVPGLRIGELLPLLAKQADKFSIIRSMTHGNDGHETAAYIMMTGTLPSAELVYPAVGAVVALKKNEEGYQGSLPPYITLTQPLGRINEAGFLGNNYKTYATGGDPTSKEFRVQGLVPPRGMTEQRLKDRRARVRTVDGLARQAAGSAPLRTMASYQDRAYGLLLGDARKAFDLSQEKDAVRDRYGRNQFGQSCLAARRLVENGVPFVTVNMGGWDTHTDNFGAMKRLLPVLDGGFATLLDDLAQRGLLESTVVTWFGEFGRTPKVYLEPPWFGGRHHYGRCFSAVVAGGGFQGGHVVGSSDYRGEQVKERPVYPWDLIASIYQLLGIDPLGKLPHPQGCVAYVSPIATGEVPTGGPLNEIM
jgi:hypothetical protein